MVAAVAWLHFNCKRELLVFHKYPVRHLGFSAEGELKTRRNKNGREAQDRCLRESSRLCPEAQILSLTWVSFRIAPPQPQYSSHALFPFVQRQALNWCFILCLFSLLGTGRILCCTPKKQNRTESWGSACGYSGSQQVRVRRGDTGSDPTALGVPRALSSHFPSVPSLAPAGPRQMSTDEAAVPNPGTTAGSGWSSTEESSTWLLPWLSVAEEHK